MRPGALLLVALAFSSSIPLNARSRDLTREEAEQLLLAALPGETRRLPGLEFEGGTIDGDFCFFSGLWSNPDCCSSNAWHFAIDRRTGDVWSAVVCRSYTSRAFRKLQRTMWRRIDLPSMEYERLRQPRSAVQEAWMNR